MEDLLCVVAIHSECFLALGREVKNGVGVGRGEGGGRERKVLRNGELEQNLEVYNTAPVRLLVRFRCAKDNCYYVHATALVMLSLALLLSCIETKLFIFKVSA